MTIPQLDHQPVPTNSIDVLIIGQATIDDIFREGEGLVSKETPGGDSIYSVLGASIWPVRIGVVTRVGSDYPRDKLASATCNPANTDWSGVHFVHGPSIHDKAYYYKDGRREYIFNDNSLLDTLSPTPEDVPTHYDNCQHVHIAPANVDRQLELLKYFKGCAGVITLDIESHFFVNHHRVLMEMLALDPIFVPSLEHVQQLSGKATRNPLDYWPWIKACGSSLVVVKCGADGAWVFEVSRRRFWQVGVVSGLNIVDTTGAGDSFCGGFLAGLKLTGDPVEAVAYASVSASFIVESWAAVCPAHYSQALVQKRLELLYDSLPDQATSLPDF